MTEPLVPREAAREALEARAELGPAYDDAVAERLARQVEERLASRARPPARADSGQRTAIAVVSMVAAIPLIAIAGGTVGLAGVIAVCVALVAVNYFAWRD